jgi:uncharacterized protein YdbL (DUF1318 family)
MKRSFLLWGAVVLASVFLFANPVQSWAGGSLTPGQVSSYKSAKASGMLMESGNGYLKSGSGSGGALTALMEQVNRLRKEKYEKIARQNGVSLQAVERSAAKRLKGR